MSEAKDGHLLSMSIYIFYWPPPTNRQVDSKMALWYADVTKGHCQIRPERLPVTGAYVVSIRCYCCCSRSGGRLRRVRFFGRCTLRIWPRTCRRRLNRLNLDKQMRREQNRVQSRGERRPL